MSDKVRWGNHTRSDDEWYTSPKLAKEFIDVHWKYIKKFKKIICPCDTEESYIYRELKSRGCDVDCCVDMWNCKYENYDLVVTNPPFSMAGKWFKWLNNVVKIKFISFCGWSTAVGLLVSGKYISEMYISMSRFDAKTRPKECFYNRPESCSWVVLSNIEGCRELVVRREKINIKNEGKYRGIYYDFMTKNYLDPKLRWKRVPNKFCVYLNGDKCELWK